MNSSRASELARCQDGLITRAQVFAIGGTESMIRHALRGRWQPVVPGIYATFTGPLNELHRMRAAVLHGDAGSVITGPVACRAHGLRYVPGHDGYVDVLIDLRRRAATIGFIRTRRTARLPATSPWQASSVGNEPMWIAVADRTPSPGVIPVAPPARAAIDTVLAMGSKSQPHRLLRDARALLSEVVQRRQCDVSTLAHELAQAPRRGSASARRILDDLVAGCRSAPECELRDLVRASSLLPEPRWNLPLPGHPSIIPDACWPEARLIVEVDSREWHAYGNAPAHTEERHALYARLGWVHLSVSPARIRRDPERLRRDLEDAYVNGCRNAPAA